VGGFTFFTASFFSFFFVELSSALRSAISPFFALEKYFASACSRMTSMVSDVDTQPARPNPTPNTQPCQVPLTIVDQKASVALIHFGAL
jgi:hypothetical protein